MKYEKIAALFGRKVKTKVEQRDCGMNNIDLADELANNNEPLDELGRRRPRRKLSPCFLCNRHLRGRTFTKLIHVEDGLSRIFHKQCADKLLKSEDGSAWMVEVK